MMDKSKSIEDQIKSLKKVENLDQYFINDFDDKELKSKIFKLKLVHLLKIINKKLFEQIFGDTLEALANTLINTTNKKENQIIVKNIEKNRDKLYEMDPFNNDWMIRPSDWRIHLIDTVSFILDFNKNENEKVNENVNENDETLMSSDKDDHDDDETMRQNEMKKLYDYFDKMIAKSKSFEDQIKSFKKVENLDQCCSINDFDDKELKSKIFKLELTHLSNIIDKKLFEQTFGNTLEALANKIINTANKEENKIIVKNIKANIKKVRWQEKTLPYNWVIQPSNQRIDLIEAIKLILDFNESELKDLVWKYKVKKWVSNFNWGKHSKIIKKKKNLCVCMYKTYWTSPEGYKNANVELLTRKTTSEIWVSMKDVGSGIGVKTYLILF